MTSGNAEAAAASARSGAGRWARLLAVAVPGVALAAFPLVSDDLFYQNMIILSLLFAVGAVGLNIISGYAGYISLGHSAFIGLGAYTVALLANRVGGSPLFWVPVGGLVAVAFAVLLGIVAMRTRGFSFVVITIAFLFLMQLVATNWDGLTRGTSGITLPIPTWSVDYQNWPFYYGMLVLLVASLVTSWWIRRIKLGMGLVAMREDEDKAGTVGVATPVYKLLGFVASAVYLGMAGGLYGYYLSFVDPRGMFDVVISVQIILSMLLGGRGTLFGPVLGAFLVEPLNEISNQYFGGGNARLLIFGGLMALTVLLLPQGILPSVTERLASRRARGRAAPVGERPLGESRVASTTVQERAAAGAEPAPLLELRGLTKRFGGLRAVDACSFAVPEGSITALIGPNGSGKTTVFNLVGGTMAADGGEVWLAGRRIDRLKPWARAHLGLGRTFQITRLFGHMSVLENVVAPLRRSSLGQLGAVAVSGAERRRAEELLDFVGMRHFRDEPAYRLSYGQQKLVELAQVLMLEPRLILLDEPAGGINPTLIERIAESIRELNRQGTTFLIVEHNLPLVLDLCDPVLVLAQGSCLAQGKPADVQRDQRVLDAYLGEDYLAERRKGS